MNYTDTVLADLRLAVLTLLSGAIDYTANEVVLQDRLRQAHGHTVSTDRLRTELAWLDEQGLLVVQRPGGIALATLNGRGWDVCRGAASVPGIGRPRPGL